MLAYGLWPTGPHKHETQLHLSTPCWLVGAFRDGWTRHRGGALHRLPPAKVGSKAHYKSTGYAVSQMGYACVDPIAIKFLFCSFNTNRKLLTAA